MENKTKLILGVGALAAAGLLMYQQSNKKKNLGLRFKGFTGTGFSKTDDAALRAQLVDIANGFVCGNGGYNPADLPAGVAAKEMADFFGNKANIVGIKEAMAKYKLPAANRPNGKSCSFWTCDTVYNCDWQSAWRFYQFAKISMKYPNLDESDSTNCYAIEAAIDAIQVDISKAGKNAETLKAYKDKADEYDVFYSTMGCAKYLRDKRAENAAKAQADALAAAAAQAAAQAAAIKLQQEQAAAAAAKAATDAAAAAAKAALDLELAKVNKEAAKIAAEAKSAADKLAADTAAAAQKASQKKTLIYVAGGIAAIVATGFIFKNSK